MPRWLILGHRIPPKPLYLRAKMRQRLSSAGAVPIKNSVYVLPNGADALEDLQWIAQEIEAGGGDAHLFEGDFVDPAAAKAAIAKFREARDADYRELADDARAAAAAARGTGTTAGLARAHARLAQRLEEVRQIDFFEARGRRAAEEAIRAITDRLERDRKEDKEMATAGSELRGRTWATRPGVKVDRMASAWFVRRFVDPRARFRFVDERSPRRDREIRFDMVGGDFTHEEDRCTLETLVRRIGLPDPGVKAIAEIVHDLDLKDGKFERPEATGVRVLLEGIMARHAGDAERIERGLSLFDDLHASLAGGGKARPPRPRAAVRRRRRPGRA